MTTLNIWCQKSEIRLTKALLLYTEKENNYSSERKVAYVSSHDVRIDETGQSIICPGKALEMEELEEMLKSIEGKRPLTLLGENVLACNGRKLVFYVPPKKRATWVHCPEPFGQRSGSVWHPGCIFFASRNGLSVFSYKGRGKPQASTPLFASPHLNVYEDGGVCMGNRALPEPDAGNVAEIESAFFTSEFTHTNRNHAVKYSGGIYELWKDLLDGKYPKGFPEDCLLPVQSRDGSETRLQDLLMTSR